MKRNIPPRLNICMLLPLCYEANLRVPPQIGICSYLTKFGHKVTWIIWSEDNDKVQPFFFEDVDVYVTSRIHYFPGRSLPAKIINKIPNTLKRMRYILKIFKQGKHDLIFGRDDVFDGLVAAYIKRRYKIPFVFVLSNPLEQEWESFKIEPEKPRFLYSLIIKFTSFVQRRLVSEADLILAISKWLKEHLVTQGIPESKIMPYPSGVDLASFSDKDSEKIQEKYHLHNSKVIIYVGTLGKPRYLNVLVEAFSKVKEERHSKLLVVGEGSDQENLKRLADELGIKDDVIFTGQVPQSEVPHFIAAADVGVSPVPPLSFYKLSSPIKMLEYMAMAKPVVANVEIPEQKEVLEQSGGGVLVPFTPEAFAKAISDLLDNPEKATDMGRRGKEWVTKNRSYEILAWKLEERYFELLCKQT